MSKARTHAGHSTGQQRSTWYQQCCKGTDNAGKSTDNAGKSTDNAGKGTETLALAGGCIDHDISGDYVSKRRKRGV